MASNIRIFRNREFLTLGDRDLSRKRSARLGAKRPCSRLTLGAKLPMGREAPPLPFLPWKRSSQWGAKRPRCRSKKAQRNKGE